MMSVGGTWLETAGPVALLIVLLGIAMCLVRLIKGPDAADRIVALDLISVQIVACLAVFSVYSGETSFLDVAIAYALIAFLGTVALARFLIRSSGAVQKQRPPEGDDR